MAGVVTKHLFDLITKQVEVVYRQTTAGKVIGHW